MGTTGGRTTDRSFFLRHYLASHKVFDIGIPRKKRCLLISYAERCRPTVRQQDVQNSTIDSDSKGLTREAPFLCGFLLFRLHRSSGMQHHPSFSLPPSHSLISALPLPVCTVYTSFDQHVHRISMYLNVPLRSRLKLPVCQRRRSCEASPRYGRRRSGLIRIFIANEHGLALPTMRERTKSLAMHVLSGPWC